MCGCGVYRYVEEEETSGIFLNWYFRCMRLEVDGVCCGFRECGRGGYCEGEDCEGFDLGRHLEEGLSAVAQNYIMARKCVMSLGL